MIPKLSCGKADGSSRKCLVVYLIYWYQK